MPTFGENLRREREMRGVSLEEISESTKISTRMLTCLETDQFTELPGGVFTRNFIRAYAQYLGLDEEHALAEYKRAAGSPSDNDLTRLAPNKTLRSISGPRPRLLPWFVIAVLLGSGYAVYRYGHRAIEVEPPAPSPNTQAPNTQTPGTTEPAASAPNSASNAGSNPAGSASSGTGGAPGNAAGQSASPPTSGSSAAGNAAPQSGAAVPANAASAAPELGEGDLVLQVSATEESWIAVAADGKTLWQHTLPANSSRTFRARDFFDVTTGNAQGTNLTLNGQAQKALGREGEFRRVHLTRDNLQAQAPQP
jgi:cytoskeleton protein RodZ